MVEETMNAPRPRRLGTVEDRGALRTEVFSVTSTGMALVAGSGHPNFAWRVGYDRHGRPAPWHLSGHARSRPSRCGHRDRS